MSDCSGAMLHTECRRDALRAEIEQLREQLRTAEAVRDDARCASQCYLDDKRKAFAALTEIQRHLLNLLARIHRDGGHYTEAHGLTKAVADADLMVANLNGLADAGRALRGHEATYCLVDPPCGGCNACSFNAVLAAISGT